MEVFKRNEGKEYLHSRNIKNHLRIYTLDCTKETGIIKEKTYKIFIYFIKRQGNRERVWRKDNCIKVL